MYDLISSGFNSEEGSMNVNQRKTDTKELRQVIQFSSVSKGYTDTSNSNS